MSIEDEPKGDTMAGHKDIKPALLTRAEIDYLAGKPTTAQMKAKSRYQILQKLKAFLSSELPLLIKTSQTWPDLLSILQPLNSEPTRGLLSL